MTPYDCERRPSAAESRQWPIIPATLQPHRQPRRPRRRIVQLCPTQVVVLVSEHNQAQQGSAKVIAVARRSVRGGRALRSSMRATARWESPHMAQPYIKSLRGTLVGPVWIARRCWTTGKVLCPRSQKHTLTCDQGAPADASTKNVHNRGASRRIFPVSFRCSLVTILSWGKPASLCAARGVSR